MGNNSLSHEREFMDYIAYINILKDTLRKKIHLLDKLLEETIIQEECFLKDDNIEEFEKAISRKEPLIEQITKLDDGFELIFKRVGDAIKENKILYQKDIIELQKYIRLVTQKSILLQGKEKSNKEMFEVYLCQKKMEVKHFKANSQAVSSYYKNMLDGYRGDSIFLDKKK